MDGKIFELQQHIKDSEKMISDHQSKIEFAQKEKANAEKAMHILLCDTCSAYRKIYDKYMIETSKKYDVSYEKKRLMEEMLDALKQWLMTEYNPNLFKK